MSTFIPFEDQRKQDASFTAKAMGMQLGINAATALVIMIGFSFLRPRNSLVYAPKIKFRKKENRPPPIQSKGYFAWIKPILKLKDRELIDKIGCDAVLYIRFARLLRQLFFWLTVLGVFALIPIYIMATKYTGDWPPPSGSIDILSLSGINYINGKTQTDINTAWYWSPFAATYLYSILIAFFLHRASGDYIKMRQHWFQLPENDLTMKSLMINPIPKEIRSNQAFKEWVQSTYHLSHPIDEIMIGHKSSRITKATEEFKEATYLLESTLARYLNDGKNINKKRPQVRVGGFLCFGGKKVDAIEYYSAQVRELKEEINQFREFKKDTKPAPYGWISFSEIKWAHDTKRNLAKDQSIRLSPTPHDLIRSNLLLDESTRVSKKWIVRIIYCVFVFAWMIPMSALSATSNLINLIRMIPNSSEFIDNHSTFMGIVQSYFTPIIMAIFFYLLPIFFHFLSKQQGYWTKTTLDRKVLVKLYVFSIINNLLIFTLTSIIVGIYGQIKNLVEDGTIDTSTSTDYIMQIAKNISQVSNFWINYVCLHSLGLTMELAMILPLITITIRKFLARLSPTEENEFARPPEFEYPKNYNLLLFFFTVSLLYSAISPLILPFAFLYFAVASMVYKYLLVYVYETRTESGGKIWTVLFQTMITSTILFQCIMILILIFKGGRLQAYLLIPLPMLTVAYQYFNYRRMDTLGTYISTAESSLSEEQAGSYTKNDYSTKETKPSLQTLFEDPAFTERLAAPKVHDDVKHLLPDVYRSTKEYRSAVNQPKTSANKESHSVIDISESGMDIQFEAVTKKDIIATESSPLHRENTLNSLTKVHSTDSCSGQITGRDEDQMPLLVTPQLPPIFKSERQTDKLTMMSESSLEDPFSHHDNEQLVDIPPVASAENRNTTSEFIEMDQMVPPNSSSLDDLSTDSNCQSPFEDPDLHQHRSFVFEQDRPLLTRRVSMTDVYINPFKDPMNYQVERRKSF